MERSVNGRMAERKYERKERERDGYTRGKIEERRRRREEKERGEEERRRREEKKRGEEEKRGEIRRSVKEGKGERYMLHVRGRESRWSGYGVACVAR